MRAERLEVSPVMLTNVEAHAPTDAPAHATWPPARQTTV